MITYRRFGLRKVPVLHRVDFPHYARMEVLKWCDKNCKANYYLGPLWSGSFVEFEDDEDAMWFKLRYS